MAGREAKRSSHARSPRRTGWAQVVLGMLVAAAGAAVILQLQQLSTPLLWVLGIGAGSASVSLMLSGVSLVARTADERTPVPPAARRTHPGH